MIEKFFNRLIYKQKKAVRSLNARHAIDKMMQHQELSVKRLGYILNKVIQNNAWSDEDQYQF